MGAAWREWEPRGGSTVEVGCKICGDPSHWKSTCERKGVVCKYCGGEHLSKLCNLAVGKGAGKGGAAKADKGIVREGKSYKDAVKGAGKAAEKGACKAGWGAKEWYPWNRCTAKVAWL